MLKAALVLGAVLLAVPAAAEAQEKADAAPLPAICTSSSMAGMDMGAKPAASSGMAMPMDEAHKAMMAGMDKMQTDMMAGMQAEDIDVAFVCGMIAHHMGAVQMSEVELKYGKDEWARHLAQKIIDAQRKEIDDMTKWLEKNAK